MIASRLSELFFSIDWSKGLEQSLPPEVKDLINETKNSMAAT